MPFRTLELTSKNAIVIDGTFGIGLTLVVGLAQAGANVIATGRRIALVDSVTDKINTLGRKSILVICDVTAKETCEHLLTAAEKEIGQLLNVAGVTKRTTTLNVDEKEWNWILQTNVTGTLHACQVFGRKMIDQKYGRIISLTLLPSHMSAGFFQTAAYAASKAAAASLTKTLAVEWAMHGVCANAIVQGVFRSDLNTACSTVLLEVSNSRFARTPMR
jgi:NAD(P)-dependent dehydrogenase (short-subunit alcohol dehydrogenase family)